MSVQTFKRYKWTWLLLLLALIMAGYLAINSLNLGKEKLPVIGEVQDFSLENVNGDQVTLADTQGKARLVYFFFTQCPDVCPITKFLLSQTQKILVEDGSFGKDTEFVSISFDPKNDTGKLLRLLQTGFRRIMMDGISCGGIRKKFVS